MNSFRALSRRIGPSLRLAPLVALCALSLAASHDASAQTARKPSPYELRLEGPPIESGPDDPRRRLTWTASAAARNFAPGARLQPRHAAGDATP